MNVVDVDVDEDDNEDADDEGSTAVLDGVRLVVAALAPLNSPALLATCKTKSSFTTFHLSASLFPLRRSSLEKQHPRRKEPAMSRISFFILTISASVSFFVGSVRLELEFSEKTSLR